jgi:hypothetical protein
MTTINDLLYWCSQFWQQLSQLSAVESKPASDGRIKTGHYFLVDKGIRMALQVTFCEIVICI